MPKGSGLFDPDGAFLRVNAEAVLVLTGPRALLLQLAHPLVAQGVADHSHFLEDTVGRLWRTLDTMLTILFAERAEALATAARLRALHDRVDGALREGTPHHPAGTPYRASDPDLLRWVSATLIDSALCGYERWVVPLSRAEREDFIAEANALAGHLGIPATHQYADFADFEAYVAGTLADPVLTVTPTARRLGDAVLHPPVRFAPRWLGDCLRPLTAGLLPPRLRAGYGIPWQRRHVLACGAAERGLRLGRHALPRFARTMPHARRAARRERLAADRS